MAVDFAAGSQATIWTATRQHAMAGELSPGRYQSQEQAIATTNAYIQESMGNGNLAAAIHAGSYNQKVCK
jgi:hypothetical protein